MILLAVGCSYRNTPVEVRERLAFSQDRQARALDTLTRRLGCEAVILSTCNRVELYLGQALDRPPEGACTLTAQEIGAFFAEFHGLQPGEVGQHLYTHRHLDAVRHLFRVAASLDSLIVGEGQIAGQVKQAYDLATQCASAGPLLHALFRHARQVARRVRTETGIAHGHVSVSSVAVDYVRQVFDHFGDKTVLVIGAGKMGEMTLRHLRQLRPRKIAVTNRSPEKALAVAQGCDGEAVSWDRLDDQLTHADIVLSTTGAEQPIMTLERYQKIAAQRTKPIVILDIAVPRDFDPRIHDGDRTCLFNIDDLHQVRDRTLAERLQHVPAAESIVEREAQRFLADWARRRHGQLIARLTQDFEDKRQEVMRELFARLDGKLSDDDRKFIEGAFRLLQNRFLNGPINALKEESHSEPEEKSGHTLLDALRKLFRL
jgi:glutamyl-tRNA reductase